MLNEFRLSLQDQVAIVAGAGSGIGAACAAELAARGARVACVDVNVEGAEATRQQIVAAGGQATSLACDVTSPKAVGSVVSRVVNDWAAVHVLVNCVGITGITGVVAQEVPLDDFKRVVSVNLCGAFIISQAVLPLMLAARYGRLLHVASIAGKEGNAGMVSYSASKAALIGMVKSMGKECAGTGVTVNALAPAVISTPLLDKMPSEQIEYMTKRIPAGRLGTLQEVADMIAWCVSPAASFTTGFTFDLSGGRATY